MHRYVLGVYELQERLMTEFPDLLLETVPAAVPVLIPECYITARRSGAQMIPMQSNG